MKGSSWRKQPDKGRRLLPNVIDDLANEEPERVIFEEAKGAKINDGFRKTTCKEYGKAISKTAWWLEKTLNGRGTNFETIGYLGPCDTRYLILVVAAIKAGYKMLYLSPRNSLEGHLAVLGASNCKIWLQTSGDADFMNGVFKHCPDMRIYSFPSLDELHTTEVVEHYPYSRSWEEGHTDPGWVLHTSGSTGLPKPIVKTLQSAAIIETHRLCEPVEGRPILLNDFIGARIYVTVPPFHSLGLNSILCFPIFYDQTILFGPLVPVTTDIMTDTIIATKPDAMITSPSLLESWEETGSDFDVFSKLKAVGYGGGPLSQSVGDIIASKTHLITILGTTESGWLTAVETDPEDWNYLRFHPNAGLELRAQSAGLFELVAVRSPALAPWQTIFSTFPDLQEYAFKDLFSPHPSNNDLWHHEGRADNIIVLSNGEKFHPGRLERYIARHPLVRTVLIAGYGRFQISAIVELTEEAQQLDRNEADIIADIWPVVVAANKLVDTHGRLQKAFIILASSSVPFLRASKGTVQRAQTLGMYADLLDELYMKNEAQEDDIPQIDVSRPGNLRRGVSEVIGLIGGMSDLNDGENIFNRSFDSLQVLTLLRRLRAALRDAFSAVGLDTAHVLTASLIYVNPTVSTLSEAINSLLTASNTSRVDAKPNNFMEMQAMLEKYSAQVPGRSEPRGNVALLTGSTGSLGSYILDSLIKSKRFETIWCFNRSKQGEVQQANSNRERGLTTNWTSHNVHFLHGDLCKPSFGLGEDKFKKLSEEVTHIFHNAWRVDFNLTLASFEPQIAGASKLIKFTSATTRRASLLFVSSVGAVQNWNKPDLIPEDSIEDLAFASRGYGQSKLITERLILQATKSGSFRAKICRVGQLAGPVGYGLQGEWNRKEWFPTIIEASACMGVLPLTLGNATEIDWIPVDIMGSILVELALDNPVPGQQEEFYHGVNAHSCSWSKILLPSIQIHLPHASVVPWNVWVSALSEAVELAEDPNKVPGAQLMAFFTDIGNQKRSSTFDTTNIRKMSRAFRELEGISGRVMELWMKQWGY